VRTKGALHMHSTLSHDGTMTVSELVDWYKVRGYDFIAIGEHSQDMDDRKIRLLVEAAAEHSHGQFLVIPGIEFSCNEGIHMLGLGVTDLIGSVDPVTVAREIRTGHGLAILVHPQRLRWRCSADLLRELDAVEIWNVAYDGKYLPAYQALDAFRRMQQANPRLLALAGHDLHRKPPAFYDVAIEMEIPELSSELVLRSLREGAYKIRSRFFSVDSQMRLSWSQAASISVVGWHLNCVRKTRDFLLRWCS
jgi:hypothetical protein